MSKVYFPTRWGDVSITGGSERSVMKTTALSPAEKSRVVALLEKFKMPVPTKLNDQEICIEYPLHTVHKAMKRILKAGKPTLTAIKLKDGHIELVEELRNKEFEVGVTVEKPPRGCPKLTVTERKEILAAQVLQQFLTPVQWLDYQRYGQLIAKGNSTGKPYLITSRWNPKIDELGRVFDLQEQSSICASSWDVPPSEEVLALTLSIQLEELAFINRRED